VLAEVGLCMLINRKSRVVSRKWPAAAGQARARPYISSIILLFCSWFAGFKNSLPIEGSGQAIFLGEIKLDTPCLIIN
jgi:hypothetical protein